MEKFMTTKVSYPWITQISTIYKTPRVVSAINEHLQNRDIHGTQTCSLLPRNPPLLYIYLFTFYLGRVYL